MARYLGRGRPRTRSTVGIEPMPTGKCRYNRSPLGTENALTVCRGGGLRLRCGCGCGCGCSQSVRQWLTDSRWLHWSPS